MGAASDVGVKELGSEWRPQNPHLWERFFHTLDFYLDSEQKQNECEDDGGGG